MGSGGGMGDPKAFLWGHGADMETLKEHGDMGTLWGLGGGDGGPQRVVRTLWGGGGGRGTLRGCGDPIGLYMAMGGQGDPEGMWGPYGDHIGPRGH